MFSPVKNKGCLLRSKVKYQTSYKEATVACLGGKFTSEDLKKALLKLSGGERALIFSRIMDEKSYKELELIYKVSAATLRKRYERAKNKLIKALEKENICCKRLEEFK